MKNKKKDFGFDKAEDSTGFLLWQVTTLWERGIKKALNKKNITHPQFVVLASLLWLSKDEKSITQVDLSQHSKIDPMTISGIVKILHKKQLIDRQEHQTDTRAKTITLTEKGRKSTRQAVEIIEKFDNKFFKGLHKKTDAFNKQLQSLLLPEKE